MSVGMMLFVPYRADQDLFEEDLVKKALLGVGGFDVGGVAVAGKGEGGF